MNACQHVCSPTVGGADGSVGEDPAGAGRHQAASVLHSAVPARERQAPQQPPPGETQTARGDPGDEVSVTLHLIFELNPTLLLNYSQDFKQLEVLKSLKATRMQSFGLILGLLLTDAESGMHHCQTVSNSHMSYSSVGKHLEISCWM